MTSQQLHDLTKALFAKHPSAKPDGLYPPIEADADWWIDNDKGSPGVPVFTSTAELIIIGHLAKWLAEKEWSYRITQNARDCFCVNRWNEYPTILDALVAAAIEVEE